MSEAGGWTAQRVVELQTHLQQLNFYAGAIDGDYGPRTDEAVHAYQQWRGYEGAQFDDGMFETLASDAAYYAAGTGIAGASSDPDGSDASGEAVGGDELAGDPNASTRQAAIDAASGEIGLVRAKDSGGTDETGEDTRYGWERLLEYFNVAAPGVWSDDVIKYLKPGLPSWCGIFTLWALKQGGASVGDWGMGTGIPGMRPVADPKPGDIGYMTDNQHHCLVVRVEGDTVYSIDGNTVGDDTGGGEVNDRTRPRSAFAGFFTVFD